MLAPRRPFGCAQPRARRAPGRSRRGVSQDAQEADGQAAALYGQYAPRVNVTRKPGEWQTYDIVYKAPRFADGKLVSPAVMTVKHNGVLVHDNQALLGPTANRARVPYVVHEERLPIQLQDHSHPVRFRNIWLRVL